MLVAKIVKHLAFFFALRFKNYYTNIDNNI